MSAPHMPIMNDEMLLECPFCGSNEVKLYNDDGMYSAMCECGCSSDVHVTKLAAATQWNTRGGHLYTADDFNQAAEERDYGL